MKIPSFVWSKSQKDIFTMGIFLRKELIQCTRLSSYNNAPTHWIETDTRGLEFDDLEDYIFPLYEVEKREDIELVKIAVPRFVFPVRIYIKEDDGFYIPNDIIRGYQDIRISLKRENWEWPTLKKHNSLFIDLWFPRTQNAWRIAR